MIDKNEASGTGGRNSAAKVIRFSEFGRVAPGGEPPYDGDMDARVAKLEDFAQDTRDRLTRIETKLETVATKAELHDMKAEMVKWIVGTAIGLGVAGITVMTFVLNNAMPKAVSQTQPIIITIPGPQGTAPAIVNPTPAKP